MQHAALYGANVFRALAITSLFDMHVWILLPLQFAHFVQISRTLMRLCPRHRIVGGV
jgi:hypothetical protein